MNDRAAGPAGGSVWDERAARWLEFDADIEHLAAPLGELAMAELHLRPGERVLDVGCGTGCSTVALASRVGSSGHVTGIDISAMMADRARQLSGPVDNIRIVHGDAGACDFGMSFDAVFSRFGVMFFSDPAAAFANLFRALRPGGRLAFVSWDDVSTNDFYVIGSLAVLSVTRDRDELLRRSRQEPFALSDPAAVTRLLQSAGFREVEVTPHRIPTVMTVADLERQITLSITVTGLRELLDGLPDDVRQRAEQAVRRDLMARVRDGKIRLRIGVLVAAAKR